MKSRQGAVVLDILITLVVFVALVLIIRSHVPGGTAMVVLAFSMFTSSCVTAVFWLAMQMFKSVLKHQREKPDIDKDGALHNSSEEVRSRRALMSTGRS